MRKMGKQILGSLLAAGMLLQIGLSSVVSAEPKSTPQSLYTALAESFAAENAALEPGFKNLAQQKTAKALRVMEEAERAQSTELVDVVVELEAKPAIDSGVSEEKVLAGQQPVIERVEELTGRKVGRRLGYLVNGFSMKLPETQLVRISRVPGVSKVRRVPVFRPTMHTAVDLTEVTKVWKDRHLDGEGMVVSILDSGIDVAHPDMKLSHPEKAKLSQSKVDALVKEHGMSGKFYTDKVPYGYNYADRTDDIYPGADPHGMHVSGIVAANGKGEVAVRGVAPEAQLLAMRVFGLGEGAQAIDIMEAVEDSVKLGADVINLSLGSPSGFSDTDNAYSRTVARAIKAGAVVVIAAGNSGIALDPQGGITVGDEGNMTNGMLDDITDMATVSSPSTIPGALSIASLENSHILSESGHFTNTKNMSGDVVYHLDTKQAPDKEPHKIVFGGLGKPDQFPADTKGNYVLLSRGELAFTEKVMNAKAAGAVGVVIYNHEDNTLLGMQGVDKIEGVVAMMIGRDDGKALQAAIEAGETTIQFTGLTSRPNPNAGKPSEFTSWGPTPELEFKPELGAPGGNIYSTLPGGKYGLMSGTSMATPHVAGATALLLEDLKQRQAKGFQAPLPNFAWVKTLMENTAAPLKHKGLYYSPRQQGAGQLQLEKALESTVLLTAVMKEEDEQRQSYGVFPLHEINGKRVFRVNLHNFGTEPRSFSIDRGTVQTQKIGKDRKVKPVAAPEATLNGTSSVTLQPGEQKVIDFVLRPGEVKKNWVEGYIRFISKSEGQPDLSMPYMGYVGEYNDQPLFDTPHGSVNKNQGSRLFWLGFAEGLKNFKSQRQAQLNAILNCATQLITWDGDGNTMPTGNWTDFLDYDPAKTSGFSPNEDTFGEVVGVQFGLLRNAYQLTFSIEDAQHKQIAVLDKQYNVNRTNISRLGKPGYGVLRNYDAVWDGTVPNPKFNPNEKEDKDKNPSRFRVREGQYYYVIEGQTSPEAKVERIEFPVKLDNTPPHVKMVEDKGVDKDKVEHMLVEISDEGTGFGLNTISILGYEVLQRHLPIEYNLIPVDESKNLYELTIKGMELTFKNRMLISVDDYAFNTDYDASIRLDIGAKYGLKLFHYWDNTRFYEKENYIALHPQADEEIAEIKAAKAEGREPRKTGWQSSDTTKAWYSTLWTAIPKVPEGKTGVSLADFDETKVPVMLGYRTPEFKDAQDQPIKNVVVTINGIEALPPRTKGVWGYYRTTWYVTLLMERNQRNLPLTVDVYEADETGKKGKLLHHEENEHFLTLDAEKPTLKFAPEIEKQIRKITYDGKPHEVIFVPENTKSFTITGEMSDNSFDWNIDGWVLNALVDGDSKMKYEKPSKDAKSIPFQADLDIDFNKKIYSDDFSAADRAGNEEVRRIFFLKDSDKNMTDEQLVERIDNGYGSGDSPSDDSERPFVQLKSLNKKVVFIGTKQPNDTIEARFDSNRMARIVVNGQSAVPTEPQYSWEYQSTVIPVVLKPGVNIVAYQAYILQDGKEVLYQNGRRTVVYDTKAPEISFTEETERHIHAPYIFTNSENLLLEGTAKDDTTGIRLKFNGDVALYVSDENTHEGTEHKFSHTAKVEDGGKLFIVAEDMAYEKTPENHSLTLTYDVIMDKDAPTIKWSDSAPADGAALEPGEYSFYIEGSDKPHAPLKPEEEPPVETKLLLNGAPYEGGHLSIPGKYTLEAIARDAAGNETREVRHFTIGDSKATMETFRDEATGVEVFVQNGQITDAKNRKLDPEKLTLHVDVVQEGSELMKLARGLDKLDEGNLKLFDIYFVAEDGKRIDVRTKKPMYVRLKSDEHKPGNTTGFWLKPVGEKEFEPHFLETTYDGEYFVIKTKHFSYYGLIEGRYAPTREKKEKKSDSFILPPYVSIGITAPDAGQPVYTTVDAGADTKADTKAEAKSDAKADSVPKTGEKLPLPWVGMLCALAALGLLAARRPLLKKLSER